MRNQFLRSMVRYAQQYETGCLEIKNLKDQKQSWQFYFRLGRLFWAGGGEQETRRVHRQLLKQFQKETNQLLLMTQEVSWDSQSAYYDFLAYLFQEGKVSIEQFSAIKNEIIVEVLFDILQVEAQQSSIEPSITYHSGLSWEWYESKRPSHQITVDQSLEKSSLALIKEAQESWQHWQETSLHHCSPNQAPMMIQPEQIKQVTAEKTFQNLQRLLTGKQSLRDIAVATKRDILVVTKVFWGYYQKGWLKFKGLCDLQWSEIVPEINQQPSSPTKIQGPPPTRQSKKFCIACVDDSIQVTEAVKEIVQAKGYAFIGINDPLRASATLLKEKPNLIFLDLIMPMTNGYEICTQLRRVSSLQDTPIVILTGKDGLIDRMRAKMVGATEYISKPVQSHILNEVMAKYLSDFSETAEKTYSSFSSSVQA